MKRVTSLFAMALILTGCAAYSLVNPQRTAVADLYTVDPQISWSKLSKGKIEVWTVDGPSLQAVRFVKGLEDGEPLFEKKDEEEGPKFKKHMTPSEIMEFVVDSIAWVPAGRATSAETRSQMFGVRDIGETVALLGAQQIHVTNLRPEKFGDIQGFRFEMSFLSKGGLEEQGLVCGAVVKEKLYLIMYSGATMYYFPKHKDDVERMIESIEIQKRET